MSGTHGRTDWAEDDDDLTLDLPQTQIIKNKDGTETIISYKIRDDGKRVKTTQRIKRTVIKRTVNPRVAERKTWPKFGAEKGKPVGPQSDTTSVGENIVFSPRPGWKASTEDKSEVEKKKANLKDAKIKCRICSGDHWTTKCPFKDTMAPEGEAGAAELADDVPEVAGALGGGGSSYVPPHLRNRGAGTGEKMGGKYERDDLATLRVTNVRQYKKGMVECRLILDAGQRVCGRERPPRHVLAFRSRHEGVPRKGQGYGPSKGLRVRQLCRPDRRCQGV